MPTIGIYVPMHIARGIASRWQIPVDSEDFAEVIRSLSAESLNEASGIPTTYASDFDEECAYKHLHRDTYQCRHCLGS